MSSQIELVRKRRGLSRQAVADRVGTSMQTIYRLERGEQRVTTDWLERLAGALDVEPAELLGDAPESLQSPAKPQVAAPSRSKDDELDWDRVTETVLPNVEMRDTFTMQGDALEHLNIMDGDHLIIERKARPAPGDVVVIEHFGVAPTPQKLARVYDPPFLISYSTDPKARKPILIESAQVRILGIVRAVMRLR